MLFHQGRNMFHCCLNWRCHVILFWDELDVEIKAPEACVKIEENDGIYFRIYTEELFLGFSENYALCTKSMKEHGIVVLQTIFIAGKKLKSFQKLAGDFPGDFIMEMPIKGVLC